MMAWPAWGLEPGQPAPAFSLASLDGKKVALAGLLKENKAVAVVFIGARCPYSKAYDTRLVALAGELRDVALVAIAPNADESLEELKEHARRKGYPFAVLHDADQATSDAWGAQKTPEAFLIGKDGRVVYHGRIDDDTEGTQVHRRDLKLAIDEYLANGKVQVAETRAFGCAIVHK